MGTEVLNCPEFQVVRPEQAVAEGCPVLTKLRHVTIRKGVQAVVEWELRTTSGDSVDISGCVCEEDPEVSLSVDCGSGSVVVRFTTTDETSPVLETDATVVDSQAGIIRFSLPADVYDYAGIFRMEIGVLSAAGSLIFTDQGLVSVERGQFGDQLVRTGPPTLTEIRMALRDSAVENNLLDSVEFSADEIMFSIVRPINEWNETPPPVQYYSCADFPWREMWLKGIIAYLLQTAVHHYMRNKLNGAHGGLDIQDKSKDREYLQLAQMYRQEWLAWMQHAKVAMNVKMAFGTMSSPYYG